MSEEDENETKTPSWSSIFQQDPSTFKPQWTKQMTPKHWNNTQEKKNKLCLCICIGKTHQIEGI